MNITSAMSGTPLRDQKVLVIVLFEACLRMPGMTRTRHCYAALQLGLSKVSLHIRDHQID